MSEVDLVNVDIRASPHVKVIIGMIRPKHFKLDPLPFALVYF